jgi:hypothetical protein
MAWVLVWAGHSAVEHLGHDAKHVPFAQRSANRPAPGPRCERRAGPGGTGGHHEVAGSFDGPDRPHGSKSAGGAVSGQVGGHAGDQVAQQCVQLVDQSGPVGGQVGTPLVEQRQHRG